MKESDYWRERYEEIKKREKAILKEGKARIKAAENVMRIYALKHEATHSHIKYCKDYGVKDHPIPKGESIDC